MYVQRETKRKAIKQIEQILRLRTDWVVRLNIINEYQQMQMDYQWLLQYDVAWNSCVRW